MGTFGERLSKLRTEKKLSQAELASRLNIAKSTLAMYETDKREPSFETVERIADFFDVQVDYLLGRTCDPSPTTKKDKPIQGLAFIDGGVEELDEEEMDYLMESLELFRRMKERKAKEREGK
ncbi:helix-turn-helix domain-containing protein [Brevibacillus agri]|uniref:helix-turn-helix domain-containing protein n=1 Tax=Brevibacillus agri TaxID=51101 RepID=UPI003D1D90FB